MSNARAYKMVYLLSVVNLYRLVLVGAVGSSGITESRNVNVLCGGRSSLTRDVEGVRPRGETNKQAT